jgi:hypothetical protein
MLHQIAARLDVRAQSRSMALLAALVLASLLFAWPAQPAAADGIVSVERNVDNAREAMIARYWTERRIRRAEPLAPTLAGGSEPSRPADHGEPGYLAPLAPGGGPVPRWQTGMPSGPVFAPSSSGDGFESGPVLDFDSPPNTTSGKVYGRLPGFGKYECSATAVTAQNRSLVLTAGHCLGEGEYGLANHVVFIPSFNYEDRPFGTWVARELYVPKAWLKKENFNYDFGAMVVNRRDGEALEEVVGGRGFAYNLPRAQIYTAFGYPANRDDAERMWYCRSGFHHSDASEDEGPEPLAIGCDMGLGASGGGWVIRNQFVTSVSSYFYPRNRELLYGPYFGDRAQRLVEEAGGT